MDNFDSVPWREELEDDMEDYDASRPTTAGYSSMEDSAPPRTGGSGLHDDPPEGEDVEEGSMEGILETEVSLPQTENDGTKDAFVSYLVTTDTDFPTFQKSHVGVRRRFTDFVYLYKMLSREFPYVAVPPLPDKHKMEYVRGDRFGIEFTSRRARSLHRFLKRLTLHPRLRRTGLLVVFLESPDWNAHMRRRPSRGSANNPGEGGVFDGLTDTFLNAFSKVHKSDRQFIEVREKAGKLDDDLGHVEKIIARVVHREGNLESDYNDLSKEFLKLLDLEPDLAPAIVSFATAAKDTGDGLKYLKEVTDQDYLGSLRDMQAYIVAIKSLLKAREQKQLDYEGLSEYLSRASSELVTLNSAPAGSTGLGGPAGFFRSKIEDVRGVDHDVSRQERKKKLEEKIEVLSKESERARLLSESFDEKVLEEVETFERIKSSEMKDTLGNLADANVEFYKGMIETWEKMLKEVGGDSELQQSG
ncbi:translation initiation factor eIF4A [Rhizina undulata]